MSEHPSPSRRDVRYLLRPGSSSIEFDHPVSGERWSGELTTLSIAGLAFVLTAEAEEVEPGSWLPAQLEIGDCVLDGEVLVKACFAAADGGTAVGGLFCPASRDSEQGLLGIVAGLETAAPDEGPTR